MYVFDHDTTTSTYKETFLQDFLENLERMFPQYSLHSDVLNKPHNIALPAVRVISFSIYLRERFCEHQHSTLFFWTFYDDHRIFAEVRSSEVDRHRTLCGDREAGSRELNFLKETKRD